MALDNFPLAEGHFSGGANLTAPTSEGLRDLLNGAVDASHTTTRLRFTIDPTDGNDAAEFATTTETVAGVALLTRVATTQTLAGTIARIPSCLRHPVFIELPLGTTAIDGFGYVSFGPEVHITGRSLDLQYLNALDEVLQLFQAAPGIYISGQPDVTVATTAATGGSTSTVVATGLALTTDAHRGHVVEWLSGANAGKLRRVIRNSSNTFQLATSSGSATQSGDQFRVWRAGSIIDGCVVVGDIDAHSLVGVDFAPTVKISNQTGLNCLVVRNAVVGFAGEIEGTGEGSADLALFAESNALISVGSLNIEFDPEFAKYQVGTFFTNGRARFFGQSELQGVTSPVVAQAFRIDLSRQADFSAVLDLDGYKPIAASNTIGTGIQVAEHSLLEVTAAVGAGAAIAQNFSASGIEIVGKSRGKISSCVVTGCANGVLVIGRSWANLRSVTGTNTTYGAVIRGDSSALINRTGTTLTGGTANVRLGNATSGVNKSWTDCSAGDGLRGGGGTIDTGGGNVAGMAESGLIIDRSAE